MKDGNGIELLEYGNLMKRGYTFAIANAGKIIALITAVISVLVLFTDISFSGFLSESFCSTLAVLLISSYIIYFSLEDAGEKLGRESEEYQNALASYRSVLSHIEPDDVTALRGFCERYVADELDFRRRSYIASRGYSSEEYSAFLSGAEVAPEVRSVFAKAKKMRPIDLTPTMLMTPERVRCDSGLGDPRRDRLLSGLSHLLPSTLCTVFTVSVMLTAKDSLSAETVIDGLLKLSALPMIAFKGYSAGYCQIRENEVRYIQAKTRLLESFISEKAE